MILTRKLTEYKILEVIAIMGNAGTCRRDELSKWQLNYIPIITECGVKLNYLKCDYHQKIS